MNELFERNTTEIMQLCAQHVVCMTYMKQCFKKPKHISFIDARICCNIVFIMKLWMVVCWCSVKKCLGPTVTLLTCLLAWLRIICRWVFVETWEPSIQVSAIWSLKLKIKVCFIWWDPSPWSWQKSLIFLSVCAIIWMLYLFNSNYVFAFNYISNVRCVWSQYWNTFHHHEPHCRFLWDSPVSPVLNVHCLAVLAPTITDTFHQIVIEPFVSWISLLWKQQQLKMMSDLWYERISEMKS